MRIWDKIRMARTIQRNSDANIFVGYYFVSKVDALMQAEEDWKDIIKEWVRENWETVADGLVALLVKIIPTPLGDAAEAAILLFIIDLIKKLIEPKRNDELTYCKLHIVEHLKV